FFDYWLEREVANVNLSSLGAKMQLVRKMAETISRVHDPLTRGEVVSRASARLGVPVADFQAAIPKAPRTANAMTERRREAPGGEIAPPHDIAMLCLLALRDETARSFLLEQNWRDVLAQTPGTDLLIRILEANLRPEDPGSLNAFMATLSPEEEGIV